MAKSKKKKGIISKIKEAVLPTIEEKVEMNVSDEADEADEADESNVDDIHEVKDVVEETKEETSLATLRKMGRI